MIVQTILQQARTAPDRVAIRSGAVVWTYGRLAAEVESRRRQLLARSPPDDLLAISVAHSPAAAASILAAMANGQTVALLPATLSAVEMDSLWAESGARFLIRCDGATGPIAWGSANHTAVPFHEAGEGSICQVTSGSTGASRLAMRRLGGIQQELHVVSDRLALSGDDRVLCASSIAHSYGLFGGLLAPLAAGAEVALAAGDADVHRTVAETRPTVVVGLPPTYRALLRRPRDDALTAVRLCLSAGAPLPTRLFESFLLRHELAIRQDYGTTETGTISIDTSDSPAAGAAGRPLTHLEIRLRRPYPIPLPEGTEGEIQIRGGAVAAGYLRSGALIPCTDDRGWYHTSDAGSLVNDGLRVGPRLRAAIAVAGKTVRPEALEETISRLPGVREAMVVAATDDRGRAVAKVVVAATGVSAAAVREWCSVQLSPDLAPDIVTMVERLPRSAAGKVLLKYLP